MKNSDESATFEAFYRQEARAVYGYVYARVRRHEAAVEIVQESFLSFYRLQQEGEGVGYERALLFRLARNQTIDWLRRQRTRQRATVDNVLPFRSMPVPTPEEILLEKERQHVAASALASLPERDQECLTLRRSGLRYGEIAAVLQLNPNSVGQFISRALQRFAEAYEALLRNKHDGHKAEKTR